MNEQLQHLEQMHDTFLWRGNQIAFEDGPGEMLMSITDEDFENGEIPPEEAAEVKANLWLIVMAIRTAGYSVRIHNL